MRKAWVALFIASCYLGSYATDARVISMGRFDDFFMDDISIYRNPANLNIYPNMLTGGFGVYVVDPSLDDTSNLAGLHRKNRDPQKPFFGGILSYSLNQSTDVGNQYPLLSVGLVLNRYDKLLNYLLPSSDQFFGLYGNQYVNSADYASPVGKVDLIVGNALRNGMMFGLGGYLAFQRESNGVTEKEMRLAKGTAGINFPIAKTIDVEISMAGALMSQIGVFDSLAQEVPIAKNDIAISGDLRLFSALTSLNGDFVAKSGANFIQFNDGKNRILDFDFGLGVNINIDRGFFWMGTDGFYSDNDSKKIGTKYADCSTIGARISFGLERNIIWDWFVWRIGGTKTLARQKYTIKGESWETTKWLENPEADASDNDLVATGWGLNIENRFKVDVVIAEDIFYTFTNLFSGNHHHIFTRLTATYSF